MKFRAFVALIVCIFGCSVRGQDQSAPVALSVPDIEVVNQDGRHLRFNSQVVDGRIAIVTGFFTTCSSMCPITQEKLSQVAKLLGPRLGKDVVIVSVSVDAENDTPARMKDWGEKFHIGPGWTLLSGKRAEVDTLAQVAWVIRRVAAAASVRVDDRQHGHAAGFESVHGLRQKNWPGWRSPCYRQSRSRTSVSTLK